MMTILRIVFFIALLCLSALGLILLLPFAKEGSSFGDLPIFAGVVGAALTLAVLWWLAVGRSIGKALIGWTVLVLPLVAHGGMAGALLFAHLEGPRLANEIHIESYREAPLIWPGFDGPVGLRITLELTHPRGADALILPPEIRMGGRNWKSRVTVCRPRGPAAAATSRTAIWIGRSATSRCSRPCCSRESSKTPQPTNHITNGTPRPGSTRRAERP